MPKPIEEFQCSFLHFWSHAYLVDSWDINCLGLTRIQPSWDEGLIADTMIHVCGVRKQPSIDEPDEEGLVGS